jgi:hypothetical protein
VKVKEKVYFYLDLAKDILKKKYIIKAIENYIEEKNEKFGIGSYGLLIFQEDGTPVFIKDKKDSNIIINSIEENWKDRPKNQSYFENGLFYLFSYISETIRKKSNQFRIIIITDTPSDLNDAYQEALFNLVSKIKFFPTFIDVIRVAEEGKRFFSDDVKLNILASDTKGGIFYIHDKKELYNLIDRLVKRKELVNTISEQQEEFKISKEDYYFYNKLASDLKKKYPVENLICYFCQEKICPVCADPHDIPKICPDCGIAFHECCAINYSIDHNLGIPHIFRCPNCQSMLKIPEDAIVSVSPEVSEVGSVENYMNMEEISEEIDKPELEQDLIDTIDEEDLLEDIEQDEILGEISEPQMRDTSTSTSEEKTKKIRVGGFFGKVYTVKKVGGDIVYQKSSKGIKKPDGEDQKVKIQKGKNISSKDRYWKPPSSQRNDKKSKVRICGLCGAQISDPHQQYCSNCGNPL